MSNLSFLIISCFLLLNVLETKADESNYLRVSLERDSYVLGEKVVIHVSTTRLLNETVELIPNYETPDQLMDCKSCLHKQLGPDQQSVDLIWYTLKPGSVIVYFTVKPLNSTSTPIDLVIKNAFFQISIGRSDIIYYISAICGWLYFLAWILSMYPQVVINFNKKSVVGLNFDYVAFSLVGYSAYAIYNSLFYYVESFKQEYYRLNPHSNIPVALNDVFFSIHGVLLTAITVVQCFIYERGNQRISNRGQSLLCVFLSPCAVSTFFLLKGSLPKLDYIYFLSYVKIILTIGKYIPQAVFNYQRKSTKGWSIENCILDLFGGVLSILQMLFLAINYDDVKFFTNNLAKLFVGAISCTFDIIFIIQHYFLYRHSDGDQEKGSNASLRLDIDQLESSSLKHSLSLDRINTISSLSKVLYERRKSFVHCICGNKILYEKQNVLSLNN